MKPLTLRAPAKVNLCLRVLGRRPDGYHDIDSLFFQVSLYDTLTLEPAAEFSFECEGEEAGPLQDNLVVRTARLLQEVCGVSRGARICLLKKIPSGAGLGGGSSDAASALLGLSLLWGLGLGADQLQKLGASLGSDVPFFLSGAAARVTGRGECVAPFAPKMTIPLLLVKPACRVSTAWAYRELSLTKGDGNYKLPCSGGPDTGLEAILSGLSNDFEVPVFRQFPEIEELKLRLLSAGAAGAVMSGSGSAVAGLFESEQKAREAARRFSGEWHVVARTLVRLPPLPGL